MLRQVIVTVMGNVDAGKSQIIDNIKRTTIVKSEPGKITQTIKAYILDKSVIEKVCKKIMFQKLKIPGLLFIDTPGHAAFTNLRKRGGTLADIAILVVDIKDGIMPQTKESLEILKEAKTPFIIALNKIDLIPGWQTNPKLTLIENLNQQPQYVKAEFEKRFYKLMGEFHEKGFNINLFKDIDDYTQTIATIPTSAKSGEGIPELLMIVSGLAQRFLESCLKCDIKGNAKGTILEVTEEKGLGHTLDTIIYDGKIKKGDTIIIGTLQGPIETKVKAIFITEKKKLIPLNQAHAATGIKISAQHIKDVTPGMPLAVTTKENIEETKKQIMQQVKETTLELNKEGIIAKADALGTLEALISELQQKGIKIKKASIGSISKKDIAEAVANPNEIDQVIIGFRIPESNNQQVKIFTNDVIYTLLENFDKWKSTKEKEISAKALKNLTWPCKLKFLAGYIFRQSNPAVIGVEVLEGKLHSGTPIMKEDNKPLGEIKEIQLDGKTTKEAKKGDEIAASIPGITVGRQIKEGDIFISNLTESEFKRFKELKKYLNEEEIQLLKEIAKIKRKLNPVWGI